jgi:hypothetical protein
MSKQCCSFQANSDLLIITSDLQYNSQLVILYKSPDNLRACNSKTVHWHRHIGTVTTVLEGLTTALNVWHCIESTFSHILR